MKRFITALFLFLPAPVAAAGDLGGDMVAATFKVVAALALVIGLMLLVYALSRRGLGMLQGSRVGRIKVVETRSLGPRKALFLVEVRGQEFLLGVGSDRIDLISSLGRVDHDAFDQKLRSEMETPS